jgi:hypothetical protein
VEKRKPSLGRDVFAKRPEKEKSEALKKILEGKQFKESPNAKEVEVRIKLTPSNIKHLDAIRAQLEKSGKTRFTRNDLIRIAITLLSVEDF